MRPSSCVWFRNHQRLSHTLVLISSQSTCAERGRENEKEIEIREERTHERSEKHYYIAQVHHHISHTSLPLFFSSTGRPSSSPFFRFHILISFLQIILALDSQSPGREISTHQSKVQHESFDIQVDNSVIMPDLFDLRPRAPIMYLYYKLSDSVNHSGKSAKENCSINLLETSMTKCFLFLVKIRTVLTSSMRPRHRDLNRAF